MYPGTNDRIVLIIGTESSVILTQALIWQLLAQNFRAIEAVRTFLKWKFKFRRTIFDTVLSLSLSLYPYLSLIHSHPYNTSFTSRLFTISLLLRIIHYSPFFCSQFYSVLNIFQGERSETWNPKKALDEIDKITVPVSTYAYSFIKTHINVNVMTEYIIKSMNWSSASVFTG